MNDAIHYYKKLVQYKTASKKLAKNGKFLKGYMDSLATSIHTKGCH